MSTTEAGRRGGSTVRDKYGEDYYRRIGKKGGTSLKEKRGSEYYRTIARKGGAANMAKYGADHFSEMGKKGGKATRERLEQTKHASAPLLAAGTDSPFPMSVPGFFCVQCGYELASKRTRSVTEGVWSCQLPKPGVQAASSLRQHDHRFNGRLSLSLGRALPRAPHPFQVS